VRRVALIGACALMALGAVAAGSTPPVSANAGEDRPDPTPTTIAVEITTPGGVVPGTPGDGASGVIPCTWLPDPATPQIADLYNDVTETIIDIVNQFLATDLQITLTYYSEENNLRAWSIVRQRFERRMVADCTNATDPGEWVTGDLDWWVVQPPNPAILLPSALARATAPIQSPDPAINPPDATAINLGMWLAVADAGSITIRVALGPVWAEVTAAPASSTYDLGTGDPIVCAGNGTPLPPSKRDSVEQGPCGHTFTDADDVGDTQFTITSTWAVTWRLSDGNTGTEPDIDVSTTVPYEIYEIQTVGRSG
jgi:hypothetical protein